MPDPSQQDPLLIIERHRAEHDEPRAFVDVLLAEFDARRTGEVRGWAPVAEEALRVSRNIGYDRGETLALLALGFVHYLWQRNQDALALMLEVRPRLEAMDDVHHIARCAAVLTGLHTTMGNYQKALEHGHDAISRMEGLESSEWKGWPHYLVGDAYRGAGDLERAREHYTRAHHIFVDQDIQPGIARALIGLGGVCRDQGDLEASEVYFAEARTLAEAGDDPFHKARTLSDLALTRQLRGARDEALVIFEESLRIRRERCGPLPVATCLTDLGKLLLELDQPGEAVERLKEALDISAEHDHKPRMFAAHEGLADAYAARGDLEKALFHQKEHQRIKEEVMSTDAATRLQNLEISLAAAAAQKEAELVKSHNEELQAKNTELARLLKELRDTQEMLIQSEKMASLGQLTAGIAHEIRNPLNFVNNFSAMTKDLAEELSEEVVQHRDEVVRSIEKEILDLASQITANADRILEHGRRASQIVTSMLVHSRQSGGKKAEVDVNELVSTSVDLAYHGSIATDGEFELKIELALGDDVGTFTVIEDEIARVLTNILNNAFHALRDRVRAQALGADFAPRLRVNTDRHEGMIEITISDNGPGIEDDLKSRIFEPFYTTKPTGSGTGLGLSQSYEIITKRHGGTLKVVDTEGGGATFLVRVPIG